ncbi:polysaccharide biosynthesis protein [Oligella sp. HMSC05A10]|uniref:lipopolysaccharide biosynthesis protein n=1 Tax=Oligella sp. HMSC05A10 TaxID=1581112 RepID=UPI0008A14BA3|nr:oligosaccharide flippase family protein [Oligella sp. HMSC05A10]OFS87270.1 polysaccharide biosynthesis protein [Oligella sp. HMSC05A10]
MINKVFGYAIGALGSAFFGFIALPLLAWFYSVEDIGRVAMLQVVASFSVLLFSLGLDQAYTREYHESDDKSKLFKHCFLPGLVLILVSFSVFFLVKPSYIASLLYGLPSGLLSIVSIMCFVLTFVSRFLSLIVRMEDRAIAYSMSQLLPKFIFVLFIVSTVLLGLQKDIYNLVIAHTLSITAVFLIFSWNTRKVWYASISIKYDNKQQQTLMKYGLPLVIGGLAFWGLDVMDKLFLRSMSTFEELGIYSVTMSVAGVVAVFASVFNIIWAPMVYKWLTQGIDINLVNKISEHVLASIYYVVVFSALFSWILPFLLPDEYAPIQYLITLCMIGPLLYTLSETTVIGIAISKRTIFSMLASIGAMITNALGNYLLVPTYGALGAAVSTTFAFVVFYILRTEFSCKVWRPIPKLKSYLIILALSILSSLNGFYSDKSSLFIFVWIVFFGVGLLLFKSSILSMFAYIKKYAFKN